MVDKSNPFEKYLKIAKKSGADEVKIIDTSKIVVGEWVRYKCQYGCSGYGECLTCPPYSPTPDTTREMLGEFSKALLMQFNKIPPKQEDEVCLKIRKCVAKLERKLFIDGYYKAFGMGAGPCPFCEECDTSRSCKHPRKARPAMEACGIDVYQTVRNAGLTLNVVKTRESYCSFVAIVLIE